MDKLDYNTQHQKTIIAERYNNSPAKSRKKASGGLVEKYRHNINKVKK